MSEEMNEPKVAVYNRQAVLAFLDEEIDKAKDDLKEIEEKNKKLIEDAKAKRVEYIKKIYPLIKSYCNFTKEKEREYICKTIDERIRNTNSRKEIKQQKKNKEVMMEMLDSYTPARFEFETGYIQFEAFINRGAFKKGQSERFVDYVEENGFKHVKPRIEIEKIPKVNFADMTDAIDIVGYLECVKNKVEAMDGETMNGNQFDHAYIFSCRRDRIVEEVTVATPMKGNKFEE